MLNSSWSMIPIFFELCQCGECSKCCPCVRRPYTSAECLKYFFLTPKRCCRKVVIIFGKFLWSILILVIFLSSLCLGGLLLLQLLVRPEFELVENSPQVYPSRIFRYPGLLILAIPESELVENSSQVYPSRTFSRPDQDHPSGERQFYLRQYVAADGVGPGLDGKRDEAMFILIEMKLPQPYQVVLFDDECVVTARSARTNRIYNRLYIGQFEELRHLKDGTLIKGIPCSRVFSFVDKIDKSLFTWE